MPNELKSLFGLPIFESDQVRKGMLLFGRFDQITDGMEVRAVICYADEPDKDSLIYTADSLREIAKNDSHRFFYDENRKCLIMHGTVQGNKIV